MNLDYFNSILIETQNDLKLGSKNINLIKNINILKLMIERAKENLLDTKKEEEREEIIGFIKEAKKTLEQAEEIKDFKEFRENRKEEKE